MPVTICKLITDANEKPDWKKAREFCKDYEPHKRTKRCLWCSKHNGSRDPVYHCCKPWGDEK